MYENLVKTNLYNSRKILNFIRNSMRQLSFDRFKVKLENYTDVLQTFPCDFPLEQKEKKNLFFHCSNIFDTMLQRPKANE